MWIEQQSNGHFPVCSWKVGMDKWGGGWKAGGGSSSCYFPSCKYIDNIAFQTTNVTSLSAKLGRNTQYILLYNIFTSRV